MKNLSTIQTRLKQTLFLIAILLVHAQVFAQLTDIRDVSPTTTSFPVNIDVNHSVGGRVFNVASSAGGSRVYAGTEARIWRSDDAGNNWSQPTRPQPAENATLVPGALPAG